MLLSTYLNLYYFIILFNFFSSYFSYYMILNMFFMFKGVNHLQLHELANKYFNSLSTKYPNEIPPLGSCRFTGSSVGISFFIRFKHIVYVK